MKPFTKTVLASLVALAGLAAVKTVLAASFTPDSSGLNVAASALYGKDAGVSSDLIDIVGGAINAVLGLVGSFFLVLIVYSGSLWMTSRGNQEQIKRAQNTMTSAVIGIIIVMGSYTVTGFVLNQILGATGTGSDTEVVTDAPDAANRPDDINQTCTEYVECLNDPQNADMNSETRELICKSLCNGGSLPSCDTDSLDECKKDLDPGSESYPDDVELCYLLANCDPPNFTGGIECTVEDQINYEACIKEGGDKNECSFVNGNCNYDVPITDADKAKQTADCWANECPGTPYNDAECINKCGGSPVPLAQGSMDSGDCIDECVNKYKHSISACEYSCNYTKYETCFNACIAEGNTDNACKEECKDTAPTPNPQNSVSEYEDCVQQCVTDPDKPNPQSKCELMCTGVEDNPLVSDTCFADCFADDPSPNGVNLDYNATSYYCNKTCLNLGIIDPSVDEGCWTANANVSSQTDRLKLCMIDDVCMDTCEDIPGKTHVGCVDECRLSHYDD